MEELGEETLLRNNSDKESRDESPSRSMGYMEYKKREKTWNSLAK